MSSQGSNSGSQPFESSQFTETLRTFVIEQLAKGKTCPEIEDDLIRHGYPVDYAIEFVAWVYRIGHGGREVYGTVFEYNDGTMSEFHEDPSSVRSRRAAQRQKREMARARDGEMPSLDPGMQEVQTTFTQELLRQRSDHSRLVKLGVAGVVLFTVALFGVFYMLVR